MPWVYRNIAGDITGISRWQNDIGQDFLEEDAPELLAFLGEDLAGVISKLKDDLDRACGTKREALVSNGFCVLEEYRLAYDQAKPWADGGYIDPAPGTVSSWATASGWTNTQAADDIIATREAWMTVLEGIRNIRLSGKAAIESAATVDAAKTAYDSAIASLGQ